MHLVYLHHCPAMRCQKVLPVSSSAGDLASIAQHLQRSKSLDSNLQAAQNITRGQGCIPVNDARLPPTGNPDGYTLICM